MLRNSMRVIVAESLRRQGPCVKDVVMRISKQEADPIQCILSAWRK